MFQQLVYFVIFQRKALELSIFKFFRKTGISACKKVPVIQIISTRYQKM